ncbi:KGK domain-containing protein [Aulosira sp. FACHB-615]|uniref:KGK domain-containing protein n=1 Tax=Aulosira sp. FACHB-615 TaxID=2692777 RepID=UPI0016896D45|nr:KGK domain-containing protein [Aulosira sp. FACHB-615]MBD2491127.1 hypothetical protein [Aulosira sp. FACHB-615]
MRDGIVLSDSDVVSIPRPADASIYNFGLKSTFKAGELIEAARSWIAKSGHETCSYSTWLRLDGLRCDVLSPSGGGWKSGRVRFRIEFIPDEPETKPDEPISPLADLRADLDIEPSS